MTAARALSWSGIFRLGLVQLALGAVVVLMTSTLNRVMTVELALPAIVPGALVGFHFLVQAVRPWMGHGSDRSGRRGPWIIGGMVVLATGGVAAAAATEAPVAFVLCGAPGSYACDTLTLPGRLRGDLDTLEGGPTSPVPALSVMRQVRANPDYYYVQAEPSGVATPPFDAMMRRSARKPEDSISLSSRVT